LKDYNRREIALAAGLSGVAGFVDAVGFLKLGGFFVSFMSGNSTRLGVGLGEMALQQVALAAMLIGLFFAGVIAGALIARFGWTGRSPVLALVATLLTVAASAFSLSLDVLGVTCLVLAMGVENAVFQRDGEVAVGLTYMTGALVKAGQRVAAALTGGDQWAWAPYLLLWGSLTLGAALGAVSYARFGALAIWAPAALTAFLAVRVGLLEWSRR
jgi:uncharacterized membrane protein YoaK (UPF0700 family)